MTDLVTSTARPTYFSIEQPYTVLGLKLPASAEEVKAAYRRMAQAVHPDRCRQPNAALYFRVVQACYDRLTNGKPYIPHPDEVDHGKIPYGGKILSRHGWVVSSRENPDERQP